MRLETEIIEALELDKERVVSNTSFLLFALLKSEFILFFICRKENKLLCTFLRL